MPRTPQELLTSPHWPNRVRAMRGLALQDDAASLGLLARGSRDPHPAVRIAALESFATRRPAAGLWTAAVAPSLRDAVRAVRVAAVNALAQTPGATPDHLLREVLLRDDDVVAAEAAAVLVRRLCGRPTALRARPLAALIGKTALLGDGRSADVSARVAGAPRCFTGPLVEVLGGELATQRVRSLAAEVLTRVGPTALPAVGAALVTAPGRRVVGDGPMDALGSLLGRLARRQGPAALPALRRLLEGADGEAREALQGLLCELGDARDAARFAAGLGSARPAIRIRCAHAVARHPVAAAAGPLWAALVRLQPRRTPMRAAAWTPYFFALKALRVGAGALAGPLASPRPAVRLVAARLAGELGHRACLPALRRLVKDPDPAVRWAAADALGALRDRAALPGLIALLRAPEASSRMIAALALGRLGDPRAVAPLRALVRRGEPAEQVAGLTALAALAPRGDAPTTALAKAVARRGPARLRQVAAHLAAVIAGKAPRDANPRAALAVAVTAALGRCLRAAVAPGPRGAAQDPRSAHYARLAPWGPERCLHAAGCDGFVACLLGDEEPPEGRVVLWYPTAGPPARRAEGTWRRGRREGPWRTFHRSGRPHVTGTFRGGARVGRWIWRDPAGRVTKDCVHPRPDRPRCRKLLPQRSR